MPGCMSTRKLLVALLIPCIVLIPTHAGADPIPRDNAETNDEEESTPCVWVNMTGPTPEVTPMTEC